MTHTPGPWTAGQNLPLPPNERITGGHRIFMRGAGAAQVYSMGANPLEVEANARLIAAAPDLLAHLEAGERTFRQAPNPTEEIAWLEQARTLIAKTKGEA